MKLWVDDRIVDSESAPVLEGFWPEGSGIFETIRTQNRMVFELGRHMRRAISTCRDVGIKAPSESLVRTAISELFSIEPHEAGKLRLHFSSQHFIALHQKYLPLEGSLKIVLAPKPIDQVTPVYKRYPYTSHLSRLEEIEKQGFHEVLSYNSQGFLTEGAVSNFLFRMKGHWFTTPLTAGVLPGVMRAIAIERCGVSVRNIHKDHVGEIESALTLSSLKIAMPISEIDGRELSMDQDLKDLVSLIREKTQMSSVD